MLISVYCNYTLCLRPLQKIFFCAGPDMHRDIIKRKPHEKVV